MTKINQAPYLGHPDSHKHTLIIIMARGTPYSLRTSLEADYPVYETYEEDASGA